MEMYNFKEPSSMTQNQYSEPLWTNTLRCSREYSEYTLKGIFVDGLPDFIYNNMQSFYSSNESADIR